MAVDEIMALVDALAEETLLDEDEYSKRYAALRAAVEQLCAENARAWKLIDDAEALIVRQREARERAERECAELRTLLKEAREPVELVSWGAEVSPGEVERATTLLARIDAALKEKT